MEKNLIKKFLEFGFGNVIVLIIGFISTPIITRMVSPDNFGKSSMFNTITNIIAVLILVGLDQAFVRFFYDENEKGRPVLLIKSMKIPLFLCIIINIIILIFYRNISIIIIGDVSIGLIFVLLIQNIYLMISRFGLLVVRMQQKAKLYSLLQVILKLSYMISVMLLFTRLGDSYNTIIYGVVISNVITGSISIIIEWKFWISGLASNSKINTSIKELVKFGYPLIFTLLVNWLFQSIDRFYINKFYGYTELGIYSSAFSIISLLNALQVTFNTFWVPISYQHYNEKKDDKSFFESITVIISVVMIFVSIVLILGKDILIMLLGEGYRKASFVMPFLIFIPLMNTVSETTVIGINFMKKSKYHIYVAIISCIANILGNIILVPKMGATGAAISTGISYIVFYIIRTKISQRLYYVNYNSNRFYICIIFLIVFVGYSTFYRFNYMYLILAILCSSVVLICYGKIILEIIKKYRRN